jgi:DNA polymerase III epsilon subunit-like protein
MKLDRGLLVLDVETTGTNPETSSIIQIGVIKLSNNLDFVDSFSCFVKPYTDEWSEEAFNVHRISKDFLNEEGNAHNIQTALELLEKFVDYKFRDYYIAQWSSSFDIAMLRSAYNKAYTDVKDAKFPYAYRVFDIASFVRLYLASLEILPKKRVSLKDCAEILKLEVDRSQLHNASYDALLTSQVLMTVSDIINNAFKPYKSLCLTK